MAAATGKTAIAAQPHDRPDAVRHALSTLFSRVTVTADPEQVRAVWHALEKMAAVSPYQSYDFVVTWVRTEAAIEGIKPFFITAFDDAGEPVALLPFAVRRRALVQVASFCGGKHSNYNMGLFRDAAAWRRADLIALLRAAAHAAPGRIDVFLLVSQPHRWGRTINPFAALPHQPSPSAAHRTCLTSDPSRYFAQHHSSHARKLLRSKRKKLEALGPVEHVVAQTHEQVSAIVAAYREQKSSKAQALGQPDGASLPSTRAFLEGLGAPRENGPAVLELHALTCAGRIVATFGGLAWNKRFSGLIISHDGTEGMAKTSPGEHLLVEVIGQKCRQGFETFDLGIGEARYKQVYCRIEDPLFDAALAITARGQLWRLLQTSALQLKRTIKQSPRLWAALGLARRWRSRLRLPARRLRPARIAKSL